MEGMESRRECCWRPRKMLGPKRKRKCDEMWPVARMS